MAAQSTDVHVNPSDETIRRWIRQQKLPHSGQGVIYHRDLLDFFHLDDAQLSEMLRQLPEPDDDGEPEEAAC